MTTYDEAVNTILRHTHALEIGEVLFSRIAMGPGASAAFGVIDNPSQSGAKTEKPVFALSGPPSGALINCETLVRPGVLKMRGRHYGREASDDTGGSRKLSLPEDAKGLREMDPLDQEWPGVPGHPEPD
jgi:molybdopterin biosynthesis enzyme